MRLKITNNGIKRDLTERKNQFNQPRGGIPPPGMVPLNPVVILCFCLVWLFVFLGSVQGDEKPIGLSRFKITTIVPKGRIEEVEFIDFNQDGLVDIFLVFLKGRYPLSQRYSAVIFQKKDKGFSDQPDLIWEFPTEASAILLGDFATHPGIEIAYLTRAGVFYYYFKDDFSLAPIPEKLLDCPTLFRFPQTDALPIWQLPRDLDHNSYDDLIIPSPDGYVVYFQDRDRKFHPLGVSQSLKKELTLDASGFTTLKEGLPGLRIADMNGDGLEDIVLHEQGELTYYLQTKAAALTGEPRQRRDVFTKRFPEKPSGKVSIKPLQKKSQGNEIATSSLQLSDINKDGYLDLVVLLMHSSLERLSKTKARIFIYLSEREKGNVPNYKNTPHQIINLKGMVPLLRLSDVNGDGKLDLITASFQVDFMSNLRKALLRYIRLTYYIHNYQSTKDRFSTCPDHKRTINFPLKLIGKGQKYFSHIYTDDFNGDGRADLLTISGPDKKRGKLIILPARPKKQLIRPDGISFYKNEYLLYPLKIPSGVKTYHLNRDRKVDIVLQYRSQLIIMLSR